MASLKDVLAAGETKDRELLAELEGLLAQIPNMLLAEVPDGADEHARSHWQRSYRAAGLRFESARHQRRQVLLTIDGVRRALVDQTGGSPSRVSLDSSK